MKTIAMFVILLAMSGTAYAYYSNCTTTCYGSDGYRTCQTSCY